MTTPASTHFKLGLLVLAAFAALVVLAFVLGFRATRQPVVIFHTYFDESVQGLEIGAPVKFRGIPVGTVSAVGIAPDHRAVDVALAITESDVARLGLAHPSPSLRADLATLGITGVKFIDLEMVAPDASPPPQLSFAPGPHYVPSRPSLFTRLESSSDELVGQAGQVLQGATATLHRVDALLDEVHAEHLPARVRELADRGSATLADVRRLLAKVDRSDLPARARRTVDAVDALVRGTTGSSEELERTLRDVGDAGRAVRDFMDALDREPDMLVKGRAHPRGP